MTGLGGRPFGEPPPGDGAVRLAALFAACLLLVTAACAGSVALRDEPLDRGESLAFEQGADRVYEVARRAAIEAGLGIDQEYRADDSTRVLLASTLLTEDELAASVRVVVRRAAGEREGRTVVTILSRRTVPTEITFGGDPWADRIFNEMVPRLIDTSGSGGR